MVEFKDGPHDNIAQIDTVSVPVDDLDLEGSNFRSQFSKIISIQTKPFDPLSNVTNYIIYKHNHITYQCCFRQR